MRVLVRGAGIIGLAVAEELLLRGHRVRVVDPAPCSGASGVAAGMLAPAAEASWAAPGVLDLGLRGLALWPGYAERLATTKVATSARSQRCMYCTLCCCTVNNKCFRTRSF